MTREEAKSCICTIEVLGRLFYRVHGVMDDVDAQNCKKLIEMLYGICDSERERHDEDYAGDYVKEEDILKFYYVESLDDYWIGRRLDNFYYATWDRDLQNFVWSKSRYLPWGEHVVAPDTLWKEHTYPSEPKEIPFVDWLKGFYTKYFAADNQQYRDMENFIKWDGRQEDEI